VFESRGVWAYSQSTVVERALLDFLGLPETVFELADDFHSHRPPATPGAAQADDCSASAAASDVTDPNAAAGVEVSDRFARLLETGASHLAEAKAAFVEQSRLSAVQARALAAFAAHRPADVLDRPDDEVGAAAAASRAARPSVLAEVSEWAVDEVMATFALPSRTASRLLSESIRLVDLLPATLDALQAGAISWAHARVMVDMIGGLRDEIRPGVEAALLAKAPGRTAAQLRAAARRAVLRADASAAAKRLARAIRDRSVRSYSDKDGMAALTALMSAPVTRACYRRLEALAEACTVPGDERTKDQRMADCFVDLLLGQGSSDRPPVQVTLTVVATAGTLTGGDEPGEIDGEPVSALQIREMAYALGLLPRPVTACTPADAAASATDTGRAADMADERTAGAATASTPPEADRDTEGDRDTPVAADEGPWVTDEGPWVTDDGPRDISAGEQAAADLAALLGIRTTAGTALAGLPNIAVVDEISGELLALTNAFEVRRVAACHRRACRSGRRPCTHPPTGPGLGPPAATDRYRPSDSLERFVRARDRRCIFPGCRARPMRCDLDHVVPWPAGPTSAENLCCLCRHHHRLSHQAPGWKMRRLPDGGLEWTLPSGERMVTRPIPFGTDDLAPPVEPCEPLQGQGARPVPPLTLRERVLGRPLPQGVVDDDPPPF
jgi:hypothetical protein